MAIDECFSTDEQAYILLAYYLGRQKLLNCIALQQITQDLLSLFEAKPRNHSTKYFHTKATCCLCKEKEDIFKKLWKDYHEQKGKKLDPEKNDEVADKVWQDVLQFWADVEKRNESLSSSETNLLLGFEQACGDILQKHELDVYSDIKSKFTDEHDFKNWMSLISNVKRKMKCCRKTIYKRSGNVTAGITSLGITKHKGLQNVLLTFLLKKRARAYAKRLQSCRPSGLMIRATREPVAVVAKYFICNKCIGKEEDHYEGFHSILDVLNMFSDHLGTGKRDRPEKAKPVKVDQESDAKELESGANGTVGQIQVLMGENSLKHPANGLDALKDKVDLPQPGLSTRKSKRVQMSNRKYTTFVYDLSEDDTEPDDSTFSAVKRPIKRRSSTLARKTATESIQKQVTSAKRRRSAPMRCTTSTQTSAVIPVQAAPADKTNVIIMTATLPPATKPGGIPQLTPIALSHSSSEKTKVLTAVPIRSYVSTRPTTQTKVSVKREGRAQPHKLRRMSAGSTAGAGTKFVLIPAPNASNLNIGNQSGLVKVLQCPPLQARERSVSLDSQPVGGLFLHKADVKVQKVMGDLKAMADPATPAGKQTSSQGTVLVRVMDGPIKFYGSGPAQVASKPATDSKACLKQVPPSPVFNPAKPQNKIQLTSGGMKILKPVAVTGQPSSSRQGGFIRLNPPAPQQFIKLNQDRSATHIAALGNAQGKIVVENINRLPIVKVTGSSSLNMPKVLPSLGKNMVFKEVKVQLNGPPARSFQSLSLTPILQPYGQKPSKLSKTSKYDHYRTQSPSDGNPCQTPKKVNPETMSRSTGKKKAVKPPSKSIALVVAEFMQSLIPSEKKEPKKKKHRSKEIKPSLLMPVPYETHFLCIYDTLAKQGWKAYWYRKCRCSKLREKSVEADIDKEEHAVQPEEVAPWIPKQLSERSRLILSGQLVDVKPPMKIPEDVNPLEISKVQKMIDFAVANVSAARVEIPKLKQLLTGGVKNSIINPEHCNQNAAQKLSTLATAVLKRKLHMSTEKPRESEAPPKRLKAVYRRDKNGNWSSASQQMTNPGTTVGEGDTVFLNIKPSKELAYREFNENAHMEDRVGITHDHGLKRSARATMLRRKALVKRALEAQVRTKAQRDRSELAATQSCIFMQFADASKTYPKFNTITPHALCYRSFPMVSIKVARHAEARVKESKDLCIPPSPAELEAIRRKKEKQQQRDRQALLSYINSPLPSSQVKCSGKKRIISLKKMHPSPPANMIELNKEATEDKFEGKLIGRLESLWNDGSSSPVKTKAKSARKKMSVLQMLPRVQEAMAKPPKGIPTNVDTNNPSSSSGNETDGTRASNSILKTISQKHAEHVASTVMTPEEAFKKIPHTHRTLRTPWILMQNEGSDDVDKREQEMSTSQESTEGSVSAADTSSSTAGSPTICGSSTCDKSCDRPQTRDLVFDLVGKSGSSSCIEAPAMQENNGPKEETFSSGEASRKSETTDTTGMQTSGKILSESELTCSSMLASNSVKGVISPDTDSGLGPELPVVEEDAGDGPSTTGPNAEAALGSTERNSDVPSSMTEDQAELSSYLDSLFPPECSDDDTNDVNQSLKQELLAAENLTPENESESEQKESPNEKSAQSMKEEESKQKSCAEESTLTLARILSEPEPTDDFLGFVDVDKNEAFSLQESAEECRVAQPAPNGPTVEGHDNVAFSENTLCSESDKFEAATTQNKDMQSPVQAAQECQGIGRKSGSLVGQSLKLNCETPDASSMSHLQNGTEPACVGDQHPEVRSGMEEVQEAVKDCVHDLLKTVDKTLSAEKLNPSKQRLQTNLYPHTLVNYKNGSKSKSTQSWFLDAFALTAKLHGFNHLERKKVDRQQRKRSNRRFFIIYDELERATKRMGKEKSRKAYRPKTDLEIEIQRRIRRVDKMSSFLGKSYTLSHLEEILRDPTQNSKVNAAPVKQTKRNKENSKRRNGYRRASHVMIVSKQQAWIKSHVQQYFKRYHTSTAVKKLKAIIDDPDSELIQTTHGNNKASSPKSPADLSNGCLRERVCPQQNQYGDYMEDSGFPTPESTRGMMFSRFQSESENLDRSSIEGIVPSDMINNSEIPIDPPTWENVTASPVSPDASLSHLDITQQPLEEEPNSLGAGNLNEHQPMPEIYTEGDVYSPPSSDANSEDRPASPFTLGELAPVSPSEKLPRKRRYGDISVGTLDGSYWSTELEIDDDGPSTSTQRPLSLRRRKNKQDDPTARYKKLNKRKRPGHGFYMSTKEQIGQIMDAERSLLEGYDGGSLLDTAPDEDSTEMKPLRTLFSRCLNVERVRSWMRDTTSAKPFRLYFSNPPPFVKRVRVSSDVYNSHSDSSLSAHKKKNTSKTKSSAAKRRADRRDIERAYFSDSESQTRKVTVPVSSAPSMPTMRKPIVSLVRCSYPISPRRERRPEPEPKRTFSSPRGISEICAKKTSSNMRVDAQGVLSLKDCELADTDITGNIRLTRPYMSRKRRLVFSDADSASGDESATDQSDGKHRRGSSPVTPRASDDVAISSTYFEAKVIVEQLRGIPSGSDLHETSYAVSSSGKEATLRPRRRLVLRDRASQARDLSEAKGSETSAREKKNSPRTPAVGLRLAQKIVANESPPVLRDQKKLQALRETVFNELKTKTSRSRGRDAGCKKLQTSEPKGNILPKPSGVDARRPRLQSTCSTRGSFISRLIEFDSSEQSSEDE